MLACVVYIKCSRFWVLHKHFVKIFTFWPVLTTYDPPLSTRMTWCNWHVNLLRTSVANIATNDSLNTHYGTATQQVGQILNSLQLSCLQAKYPHLIMDNNILLPTKSDISIILPVSSLIFMSWHKEMMRHLSTKYGINPQLPC